MNNKYMNMKKIIQGKQILTDRSSTSMVLLLSELSDNKYNPINASEEFDLYELYKNTKDISYKNKIIESNLRFMITLSKSYITHEIKFNNEKAVLEDVFNAAVIGMIEAFDKYDNTKGFRFLTYATWHAKAKINQYLYDTLADIRMPANMYKLEKQLNLSINSIKNELKLDELNDDNLIVEHYNKNREKTDIKLSSGLLSDIRGNRKNFISFNKQLNEDLTLLDTFKDNKEYEPDYNINNNSNNIELNKYLESVLKPLEKTIIEYTYGLNDKEEKTLNQISDVTDLTRERIGQILNIALKKLKSSKSTFKNIELC